ncbi:MAG: hypothetical protein CVV64_14815 [Candidatus Wallbacteria bacterium HGW-Wallbacteria-1]|jgi:nucleotide-binding universal stress UspA family protein|uniref:Universal stress protein n=1 Tax=Candidatus Wallbacteria bacterium HGW-Wallbacteria-1 TaxID=2013854 RepID=A0A2N1PLW8_9BACT|nr:MAG: hypothetical protein CVV64_14815 [Candidatus Wallbacteria bacterium HGW-Wallbacteria-1]
MEFKKILVPVDFSQGARRAFEYAANLCLDYGASITVINVVEEEQGGFSFSDPLGIADKWVHQAAKKANSDMDELLGTLGRELEVDRVVVVGDPSKVLLKKAIEENYDLIVLGAHGRSGAKMAWLGGIAYNIVRKAPCPVLAV